jgi:Ni/Fe-hydrogenase subunit HybB-like protein
MHKPEPLGGKILSKPFMFFMFMAFIGLFLLANRFLFGLGAVTNMNNGYPMGLWIVFDLVIGTAFACGGYALAVVVYIVNKGEYHPLVRPALLTSVLGYTLGSIAVFFDIGRYWNAFNIVLPWQANPNSVMLELALCVMLYTVVLWIEFSPTVLERMKAKKQLGWLNKSLFIIIALGVLLPTMHQSSMGSMLIALGHKISPLWQTDLLPLLALMSAFIMGLSIVIFEGSLSSLGFWRPLETKMFEHLATIIRWVLGAFLLIRFADLAGRGALGLAFAGDLQSNMFLLENLLCIVALLILSVPKYRANPMLLFIAATGMLLGGMLFRLNAFLIGYSPGPGYNYFPSVPEILVSLSMVSIEIMAFIFLVKTLPILTPPEQRTA